MASKFDQFLSDHQIDVRRVLIASRKLERLRPEDRIARQKAKKSAGDGGQAPAAAAEDGEAPAEQAKEKPRSGRPVTTVLLDRARAGKKISGPAKTRVLRAVNHVLEKKGKDPVQLRDVF